MGERRSTSRSRDLGIELAKIRRAARLNAQAVADALGCAASKVSRIEKGKLGIDDTELIAWLHLCGALPHMQRLLKLNRESSQDSWLQHFDDRPDRTLIAEETRAQTITWYELAVIPGLLQTAAYIRTFVRQDDLVRQRLDRQKILRGASAPQATFFIEEQALLRPIGGALTMREQLDHLLKMSEWKKVTIRVVPTSIGRHPGLTGSFILFDSSVVYTDTAVANIFLENPADIARYQAISKSLAQVALSPEESRLLIRKLREDRHDPAGDLA
jgi:transcriptional regulator with XRE-family HTH domain